MRFRKKLPVRRLTSALGTLAVAAGFSASCSSSGSNAGNAKGDAGAKDATSSSSSSGGAGPESGPGPDAGSFDGGPDCGSGDGSSGTGPASSSGSGTEGDSGSQAPSCAAGGAGLTNCGAGSESCCTSLEVAGGTYYRTYVSSGCGPTGEADPASVSGFRLDKYEVTVGRFRRFVNAWDGGSGLDGGAGYEPSPGSGKHAHLNGGQGLVNDDDDAGVDYETGWLTSNDGNVAPTDANLACDPTYATWTPSAGNGEKLPITCVNWYEAYAFCIWDGGFLPTEAEWEYAAAGGSQQREYPWGTAAPGTNNHYAIYDCDYPSGPGSCGDAGSGSVANIAPAGSAALGAGFWGQLDVVGNVWGWNLDWYAPYRGPCTDCANLTAAVFRAVRGGDFNSGLSYLHPPVRFYRIPSNHDYFVGFRCARAP